MSCCTRDDDAMREFMSVRASVLEEQTKMKKATASQSNAVVASSAQTAPLPASHAPAAPVTIERVDRAAAAAKFSELLLDHEYMQRLGFPGTAPPPDGQTWTYSSARQGSHAACFRPVVAIDCEMVITSGGGQELARLTAVDEHGSVLLDMLVVPEAPVVNYNTQFSGITKELLKGEVCFMFAFISSVMTLNSQAAATALLMHILLFSNS
jgi:hypothetical protein